MIDLDDQNMIISICEPELPIGNTGLLLFFKFMDIDNIMMKIGVY